MRTTAGLLVTDRIVMRAGAVSLLLMGATTAAAQQPQQGEQSTQPGQPSQGDEEVVREAQPSQSVENVLREEHSLFSDRLTFEPRITYSYSDRSQLSLNGLLVADAIFLGDISVDDVKSHTTTIDLNTRYGITDRLEAELNVPFLYRKSNYQSTSGSDDVEASVDEAGIGDVSASLYYRVFTESESRPDLVWNLGVTAPTGKDPFGIPRETIREGEENEEDIRIPTELPTGNGVWALTTGASVLKTLDPAIVFANMEYKYNFEESFSDITADDENDPGKVKLGDSIRFGFGTAFALNESLSLSLSYSHEYIAKSERTQDGERSQEVIGSDANIGTMNFGATYALSDQTSLVTNVGVGVTDDASDITLSFHMPMQF